MAVGCHDKPSVERLAASLQYRIDNPNTICRSLVAEPKKNHSSVRLPTAMDQFTEILVVGHDHAGFGGGSCEDACVVGLLHFFSNSHDVVPRLSQEGGNGRNGGFVDKESHGQH
jgi:hypothetical protein